MTREEIIHKISKIPVEEAEVLHTSCRPPEKSNEILKICIDGHAWYCERPKYHWTPFDQYFIRQGFYNEDRLVYPNMDETLVIIDDRGLCWVREELSTYGLLPYYIQHPQRYLAVMADHHEHAVQVIKTIEQIAPTLQDPTHFSKNIQTFRELYTLVYSYQASVFNIYDELVWQFRELLKKHLPLERVNTYFPRFLLNEYTREAMKRGLMEGSEGFEYQTTRGVLYAMQTKPASFSLPIHMHQDIEGDREVLDAFRHSSASLDDIHTFLALRIMMPVAVQIAEEVHVVETSGLSAHLGILMNAIAKHLHLPLEDIQNGRVEDLLSRLQTQSLPSHDLTAPSPRTLKGFGVASGRSTGRVKIVPRGNTREDFEQGDILVTHITDPTMVTQMGMSAGIICEIGGLVSHPSILSRELGIPCVVQVADATTILRDGQLVTIDGDTGTVAIHDELQAVYSDRDALIDEAMRSVEAGYARMDTKTIDFDYTWIDPWIAPHHVKRILKLIEDVRRAGWTPREIACGFPNATQVRISGLLFDLFVAVIAPTTKEDRLKIFDFYSELLHTLCREDPFALAKNVVHSDARLREFQRGMKPGSPKIAKKIGRMTNAGYHVSYGLWTDMYPSITYESYGPYDASENYGDGAIMVIKEFMRMKPVELWPYTKDFEIEQVVIPVVYKGVDFRMDPISHVMAKGDLLNGLIAYDVVVDGRSISENEFDRVITILEKQARRAWKEFKSLDEKGLKRQYTRIKAYNYKKLYDALGQPWEFPEEVYQEIESKPLLKNFLPTFANAAEQAKYFARLLDPRTDFPKNHWSEHFVSHARR